MEDARNDDSASSPYNATNTLVPPSADSPSTVPSNKKRRGSPSTSRGVANLTPEQLAKKRANDREAQRAIRERTKSQIEALERRIEQLTAQQPYQDLQHVVRQKEAVEAENEEIKRRLTSVLGILHSIVGASTPGGTFSMQALLVAVAFLLSEAHCIERAYHSSLRQRPLGATVYGFSPRHTPTQWRLSTSCPLAIS